ncbi:MAG: sigma-70 family RNA polymerase sigma factor [Blastocatellia bacterium]|nr:sigma-70 family RNA polymerase sigma factor [Blastocatellia bacterium]
MDRTLAAFLETRDTAERGRLLQELILEQAAPAVQQALRYRLRFYAAGGRPGAANPDAEDLYHDVLMKLVKALNQMHSREGGGEGSEGISEIKDFRQYAMRVAVNSCNDYLRSKYPLRTRLKDKVRDTLERHREFVVWRSEQGELVCGLEGWGRERLSVVAGERARALEERPELLQQERLAGGEAQSIALPRLLREIFEWVRSPVELESLVNATAILLDIREHQFESIDDESSSLPNQLSVEAPACDRILEGRVTLEKLWKEIRELPIRQRDAIIYTFNDSKGDDLLSLLFEASIVTPSQMASELGVSEERLMTIWKKMPMRNVDAAILMGVDRQTINKWRYRARKHLGQCFQQMI